jgi:hypothetical protein
VARYVLISTASSWLSFAKYVRARSFCELRLCCWPDCNFEKRNGFDQWFQVRAEVISRDTQEKSKVKLPATLREWRVSIWISNPKFCSDLVWCTSPEPQIRAIQGVR